MLNNEIMELDVMNMMKNNLAATQLEKEEWTILKTRVRKTFCKLTTNVALHTPKFSYGATRSRRLSPGRTHGVSGSEPKRYKQFTFKG